MLYTLFIEFGGEEAGSGWLKTATGLLGAAMERGERCRLLLGGDGLKAEEIPGLASGSRELAGLVEKGLRVYVVASEEVKPHGFEAVHHRELGRFMAESDVWFNLNAFGSGGGGGGGEVGP